MTETRPAPATIEDTIAALNTEQEKQLFEAGEEEYEHLLLDLKALGLGLDHLPVQEDQTMFDQGEESEAHGALDSMMKEEEKVGVPRSLLAFQDMDWDDNVWCGMDGRRRRLCVQLLQYGRGGYAKHRLEGERWYARLLSVRE